MRRLVCTELTQRTDLIQRVTAFGYGHHRHNSSDNNTVAKLQSELEIKERKSQRFYFQENVPERVLANEKKQEETRLLLRRPHYPSTKHLPMFSVTSRYLLVAPFTVSELCLVQDYSRHLLARWCKPVPFYCAQENQYYRLQFSFLHSTLVCCLSLCYVHPSLFLIN